MTRKSRGLTAALCLILTALGAAPASAVTPQTIRFSVNPNQLNYLPLFVAADRGYFRDVGLDVRVIPYKGSANTQMPLLARGDIDISSVVAGPALFNQLAEGFNIKLIAALSEPRDGYQSGVALVVRKDLWDSGAIRRPADLKGKTVDGAAQGNPIDFLMKQTLLTAGLSRKDVRLVYKVRSPSDFPEVLRQKLVDVAGISEPTATLVENAGLGVRWLSYPDIVPWFQETYLSASEGFLKDHSDSAVRFLTAYLRGVREVSKAQGQWTPDLMATAIKWTGISDELLRKIGGIPYWDPSGRIRADVLARVQQFWRDEGLVRKPADLAQLVDVDLLHKAQQGLRPE
jgi:NitT/TauT family transport system substrate-binding protein